MACVACGDDRNIAELHSVWTIVSMGTKFWSTCLQAGTACVACGDDRKIVEFIRSAPARDIATPGQRVQQVCEREGGREGGSEQPECVCCVVCVLTCMGIVC